MKLFNKEKIGSRRILTFLGFKFSYTRDAKTQANINGKQKRELKKIKNKNINPNNKKVFDCFMFFNELELLHLRFMEYYDVVDYFVIVESNKSHTGKPRDLIFEANKQKFKMFLDKVIYVKVEDLPIYKPDSIWVAENFQRNAIQRGLEDVASIGDIVFISDCDEFWDKNYLSEIKKYSRVNLFTNELYYYYVNCMQNCVWGSGSCAYPYPLLTPQEARNIAINLHGELFKLDLESQLRIVEEENLKPEYKKVFFQKGWHYSYMGGAKRIREKVENIAESHMIISHVGDEEIINKKLLQGYDLWNREEEYAKKFLIDLSLKTYKPNALDQFLTEYPNFVYKLPKKEINKNIEIISLIYCSVDYLTLIVSQLKQVKENAKKSGWDIGIRIVANDANEKVLKALRNVDIPYSIFNASDSKEYYINRVYRCYNDAVRNSTYDNVCLVNSDMIFAKDWLDNLLKYHNGYYIPVSRLIESGKMPSGKYGISKYFGNGPNNIEYEDLGKYIDELKTENEQEFLLGGLYMPVIFEKSRFLEIGGYPEGNIYEDGLVGTCNGRVIKSGDNYFFDLLKERFNMSHITICDSLCYHIQEGERDEENIQ